MCWLRGHIVDKQLLLLLAVEEGLRSAGAVEKRRLRLLSVLGAAGGDGHIRYWPKRNALLRPRLRVR